MVSSFSKIWQLRTKTFCLVEIPARLQLPVVGEWGGEELVEESLHDNQDVCLSQDAESIDLEPRAVDLLLSEATPLLLVKQVPVGATVQLLWFRPSGKHIIQYYGLKRILSSNNKRL